MKTRTNINLVGAGSATSGKAPAKSRRRKKGIMSKMGSRRATKAGVMKGRTRARSTK
tara:strand:- start:348 stop:518 length:171 start_codon:yes stop_codon:yes gene_type:complete